MDGDLPLHPRSEGGSRDELVWALRDVQDLVAAKDPPAYALEASADLLRQVAAILRLSPEVEMKVVGDQWSARTTETSALVPPFVVERSTEDSIVGRVTFSRFFHGGGGAVHGGVIPLLFDHVIGRLSNSPGRPRTRTAYLHVNYRRITPVGRDLTLDATLDRVEGRKMYATARLRDGDDLLADGEGLYVELRPGQP